MTTQEFTINRKPSKSGKKTMFYPTINGLRINRANFSCKWEAVKLAKSYLECKKRTRNNKKQDLRTALNIERTFSKKYSETINKEISWQS